MRKSLALLASVALFAACAAKRTPDILAVEKEADVILDDRLEVNS